MGVTTSDPLRRSALADGRQIVVREATEADLPGLRALYDGLDDDARYRRFFSLYRPGDRFYQRLLDGHGRGGACLVALVDDPAAGSDGEGPEVVGEADYQPLPNGDGELAITVDRRWRGWLGPYLLDALLDHAAAHGVANLEADVLVTNRPMLALLRHRRCALLPRTDWSVVRMVVGSGHDLPDWPPQRTGHRVLVEGGGGHWPSADDPDVAGFEVVACAGPGAGRARCPLLCGERCPLVDGADVIVMTPATTGPDWDEVRAAHRRDHPGVPVVVEGPHPRPGAPDLVAQIEARLAACDDQ